MNILHDIAQQAKQADVFADVQTQGQNELICTAKEASAPAQYIVKIDTNAKQAQVLLQTADRWLSESIETDLMHSGDSIEELIEDELAELDSEQKISCEHFRDDDLRYTFLSRVMIDVTDTTVTQQIGKLLLAYEAAFRELGDMAPNEEH